MGNNLWAPWRIEYITGEKPGECILCPDKDPSQDRERLILHRSSLSFVMMNRYPYNNGHLMISPFRHVGNIEELDADTALDIHRMLQKSVEILRQSMRPEGFNIGINLGHAAGAGVQDHLHVHVVPRWNGDTNFMPVLGDTRVMPEYLQATYEKLSPFFQDLKNPGR